MHSGDRVHVKKNSKIILSIPQKEKTNTVHVEPQAILRDKMQF